MIPELTVPQRLRIAREAAGYDRNAGGFADALDLSRQTISSYERGHTEPDRRTLMAWAMTTGVPVWWLQGEPGPMPPALATSGKGLPLLDSNQQPAGYRSGGISSLADKRERVTAVARIRTLATHQTKDAA
jgi:transcriptional regulator with XRE-family HTH domain